MATRLSAFFGFLCVFFLNQSGRCASIERYLSERHPRLPSYRQNVWR